MQVRSLLSLLLHCVTDGRTNQRTVQQSDLVPSTRIKMSEKKAAGAAVAAQEEKEAEKMLE